MTTTHHDGDAAEVPVASIASLRLFQDYHWLKVRAFWESAGELLGDAGQECVERGFRETGRYRGQAMRDSAIACAEGRSPLGFFRHWESAEWHLALAEGGLTWDQDTDGVTVRVAQLPGLAYAREHGLLDALRRYWKALFEGAVSGYDRSFGCAVEIPPDGTSCVFRVTGGSGSDEAQSPGQRQLLEPLDDPAALLRRTRRTAALLGATQLYPSRELSRSYDASGEAVIRLAGHRFGAERGSAIREKHLESGVPINLASFMGGGGLQERDPAEAVFVFRGRHHLSAGAWYADCTYCPLAEVWGSDATDGYRLAAMFDSSNHLGLYQSYHPGTVVRWDAVQSRGDAVCKFRFTIPELMTADDPTPEEFEAAARDA